MLPETSLKCIQDHKAILIFHSVGHVHKYTQGSSTYTKKPDVQAHTPLVSVVQSPLQKPLSHRNQRARRGIKAVYIMKLKELSPAVSLTAPRKAVLLLQRIEEMKRKKRRRKSPRTMQHNNGCNSSKEYSEK